MANQCVDCGKLITDDGKTERCRSCASKVMWEDEEFRKRHATSRIGLVYKRKDSEPHMRKLDSRLIAVCLNCTLPDCKPHSLACPYPVVEKQVRLECGSVCSNEVVFL